MLLEKPSGHGRPRQKSWTSAPKNVFREKLFDPLSSGSKRQEYPREIRTEKLMFLLFWETDFYTPPVLGGAALLPFSAPEVYRKSGFLYTAGAENGKRASQHWCIKNSLPCCLSWQFWDKQLFGTILFCRGAALKKDALCEFLWRAVACHD